MNKSTLLDLIQTGRSQFEARLAQFDETQMTQPGRLGDWSLKDLVAHITWFEQEMVDLLATRTLTGSELWALPTDERNAAIFTQNKDRPLVEVLDEARQVYARLLGAMQILSYAELNDPARFQNMPPDWIPWRILADNTYEHYADHLSQIQD